METEIVVFLIVVAALALIPSLLSGAVLRRHAEEEGVSGFDWIPFWLLPYAIKDFQHKNKFAIVWAYVFSNMVLVGAIVTFLVMKFSQKG